MGVVHSDARSVRGYLKFRNIIGKKPQNYKTKKKKRANYQKPNIKQIKQKKVAQDLEVGLESYVNLHTRP